VVREEAEALSIARNYEHNRRPGRPTPRSLERAASTSSEGLRAYYHFYFLAGSFLPQPIITLVTSLVWALAKIEHTTRRWQFSKLHVLSEQKTLIV
jgi:hypothetical protein